MRTLGLSPKAILAFLFPTIAAAAGVGAHWIVTGELDTDALRLAAGALVASAVAALGAYVGNPGDVVTVIAPEDRLDEAPFDLHAGDA